MDVTFIRLSRPLLINTEGFKTPYYQTVYGFVIPIPIGEIKFSIVDNYVDYLAFMHDMSNGGNLISKNIHSKQGAWLDKIGRKCRKKLNLTYDIIRLDIDEEDYDKYVNEEFLIVDEIFYSDLGRYLHKIK